VGYGCLTPPLAKLDTLEKLHVYDLNSPPGSPPISTVLVPKGTKYVLLHVVLLGLMGFVVL